MVTSKEIAIGWLEFEQFTPTDMLLLALINDKEFELLEQTASDFFIQTLIDRGINNNALKRIGKGKYDVEVRGKLATIFNQSSQQSRQDFMSFVDTWINLWPTGVKSGGYYIRRDKKDIEPRLRKFIDKYKQYDQETILKATEAYIDRFRCTGWKYIMNALYFIKHEEKGSTLAAECANYIEKEIYTVNHGERIE